MNQKPAPSSISQATEDLCEIPHLYAQYKGESHEERARAYLAVEEAFERVRDYLDRQNTEAPRDWEAETDLKTAYQQAQEILEQSFNSHIAAFRVELARIKEMSLWGSKK